jgi:hypothetical protein
MASVRRPSNSRQHRQRQSGIPNPNAPDALIVTDGQEVAGKIIARDHSFFAFDAVGQLLGEYETHGANWGCRRENAGRAFGARIKGTGPLLKFRDLCRSHDEEAVERLLELMRQKEDLWLALSAADKLLQYGHGKPKDSSMIEQDVTMQAEYPTLEEMKADLIAHDLPVDHLEAPKLIEQAGIKKLSQDDAERPGREVSTTLRHRILQDAEMCTNTSLPPPRAG